MVTDGRWGAESGRGDTATRGRGEKCLSVTTSPPTRVFLSASPRPRVSASFLLVLHPRNISLPPRNCGAALLDVVVITVSERLPGQPLERLDRVEPNRRVVALEL